MSVSRYTDPRSPHHYHHLLLLFLTFALFTKEELTKPQGAPPSAERANRIWPGSVTGASADLQALLQQPAPPQIPNTTPLTLHSRPHPDLAGGLCGRGRGLLERNGPGLHFSLWCVQGPKAWKPLPPAPSNSSNQRSQMSAQFPAQPSFCCVEF